MSLRCEPLEVKTLHTEDVTPFGLRKVFVSGRAVVHMGVRSVKRIIFSSFVLSMSDDLLNWEISMNGTVVSAWFCCVIGCFC